MIAAWRVLGLGLGFVPSTSSHADGAAIAKSGVGAAPACPTCHGPAGEGMEQVGASGAPKAFKPLLESQP